MDAGERIAELEALVARLEATVAELSAARVAHQERIAELERLLGESRRSGKRQAAPFSRGSPKPEPKRPGRKSGDAHGRHGHRATPMGPPDRDLEAPLPGCCPDCGGGIDVDTVVDGGLAGADSTVASAATAVGRLLVTMDRGFGDVRRLGAPVDHRLAGTALVVGRALRTVEPGAHRLRQKLLARRLARSLSPDEWTRTASDDVGLTAEDLRRRSEEIRLASQGRASGSAEPNCSSAGTRSNRTRHGTS